MKRNCSYRSTVDLLSLLNAHQRMQVPIIGHNYSVLNLSECALRQNGRDVRSRLSVLEYGRLKNANPARIPTISADVAQDLQRGM
jgi:hypothetical protein